MEYSFSYMTDETTKEFGMNKAYITLASAFALSYSKHSTDNKAQFQAVWDTIKVIPKESRVEEVKLMKKASESTIKLDSARREYKKVLTMAEQFAMLPDRHINLTRVTFDNLKRVLSLVNRVEKHYEGDMTKLVELTTVYKVDRSPHNYNNDYEKVCKKLNDALPAIVVQKAVTTEDALLYADTLGVAVKTALFERLLADLGYSIAEVA